MTLFKFIYVLTYFLIRALNDLVNHVKVTTASVNTLQNKMRDHQEYTLIEREQSAREKDEELKR